MEKPQKMPKVAKVSKQKKLHQKKNITSMLCATNIVVVCSVLRGAFSNFICSVSIVVGKKQSAS